MTQFWWVRVTEVTEHYVPVAAASTDQALAAARAVIDSGEALSSSAEDLSMDVFDPESPHQAPEHVWVADTAMWVPTSTLHHLRRKRGCCD